MIEFRVSVLLQVAVAFKEPTATTENRVIADIIQMVSQVVHAIQLVVAIPASKARNHFAGEWVGEVRNAWLIVITSGLQTPSRTNHTYEGCRSNRNLHHRRCRNIEGRGGAVRDEVVRAREVGAVRALSQTYRRAPGT